MKSLYPVFECVTHKMPTEVKMLSSVTASNSSHFPSNASTIISSNMSRIFLQKIKSLKQATSINHLLNKTKTAINSASAEKRATTFCLFDLQ